MRVPAELKDRRPLTLVYSGTSIIGREDAVRSCRVRDYEVYVIERRVRDALYFDVWRALHPRSGPINNRPRSRK